MKNAIFKLAVILLFLVISIEVTSRFLSGIKVETVVTKPAGEKKGYGVPRRIDKEIFLKLMKKGALSDKEALFYEPVKTR